MPQGEIQSLSFNQLNRSQQLQLLQDRLWDVVVIGAGINGAGVALEAAYRGLSVAVIDQHDFAYGTSSRSTKLAHGGIRYLAQRAFGLVREAATERNWLRDHGLSHMTRPTRFLYPFLEAGRRGTQELPKSWSRRTLRLAFFMYDLLCGFGGYKRGKTTKNVQAIHELEPLLDTSRLTGAAMWYDSNIDDARLVIETLKEAIWKGNAAAMNYLRVIRLHHDESGRIEGVQAIDQSRLQQEEITIKGKVIVNTTGVWADELLALDDESHQKLLRPTKGVHLVYHRKDFPINDTFALNSIDDKRFFFLIRRNEWVLVGTTDTDFSGNPAECYCTGEDADYLRNSIQVLFPEARISDEYIQGTYAGLRPLVAEVGISESEVSRKHTILEREDGLFSLLGGKLTIFRKMAEDLLVNYIRKSQKELNLPKFSGKKNLTKITYAITITWDDWQKHPEVTSSDLDPHILLHLYQQYGRGGLTILQGTNKHPEMAARLLDDPAYPVEVAPWIIAEIDYVVEHEAPLHLEDVLCRRMEICWLVRPEYQGRIAATVAKRMGGILGWSPSTIHEEIQQYLSYVKKNSFFFKGTIPVPR
ncbi:MAG: FAD-dependent oxidoreductase [Candidatus Hodarchaeota archaeon]